MTSQTLHSVFYNYFDNMSMFVFQRVDLFNAYAMAAMCRAGFLVLDVYPLTSSYPRGPVDGVHYNKTVFASAEDILEEYFST